jgi:hypothetical protein
MMERTSNRSIAARAGDAVSGNADMRRIMSLLKHASIRTLKMVMPDSLAAQQQALSSNKRPTPTGQRLPENSTSETLSP